MLHDPTSCAAVRSDCTMAPQQKSPGPTAKTTILLQVTDCLAYYRQQGTHSLLQLCVTLRDQLQTDSPTLLKSRPTMHQAPVATVHLCNHHACMHYETVRIHAGLQAGANGAHKAQVVLIPRWHQHLHVILQVRCTQSAWPSPCW
jgi:hypothetical protein